jgi:hypothetical protein
MEVAEFGIDQIEARPHLRAEFSDLGTQFLNVASVEKNSGEDGNERNTNDDYVMHSVLCLLCQSNLDDALEDRIAQGR